MEFRYANEVNNDNMKNKCVWNTALTSSCKTRPEFSKNDPAVYQEISDWYLDLTFITSDTRINLTES